MCNISLSESISHVEPGILVFDCGKEILYLMYLIYLYCYISTIVNITELQEYPENVYIEPMSTL